MSKGRNTTVVGIRLPDEVINNLKALARKNRVTMTELLKPVILDFSARGHIRGDAYYFINKSTKSQRHLNTNVKNIRKPEYDADDVEEPPDLEKDPDYSKDTGLKFEAKYSGTPRNAPCPCGAKNPDGSPKKYKRCHGRLEFGS